MTNGKGDEDKLPIPTVTLCDAENNCHNYQNAENHCHNDQNSENHCHNGQNAENHCHNDQNSENHCHNDQNAENHNDQNDKTHFAVGNRCCHSCYRRPFHCMNRSQI